MPFFVQAHYSRRHSLHSEQEIKEKFRIPDPHRVVHSSGNPEDFCEPPSDSEHHAENSDLEDDPVEIDGDDEDGPLSEAEKDQLRNRTSKIEKSMLPWYFFFLIFANIILLY